MKKHRQKDVHKKELDTLLRFSALINSSLKIEDVLNYAMKWAEEFMNAEASTVYELDEEKGELFVRIARGKKTAPVKRIRLKVGEGIAGRVVQTGKPVVSQDVRKEAAFSGRFDFRTGFTTRSMICVPLLLRDRPAGALQVLNKRTGEPFSATDLELLTGMSQLIAVALDNAKLYRRLQKRFQLTEKELKKTQARLIRSERLAAMGHLVQGVAHEIRNPVTTIGGFAWRLQKQVDPHSKLHKYAGIILEETERLENLVQRVREFSQLQPPTLRPEHVEEILRRVTAAFQDPAEAQGVTITTAIERDLPEIPVDRDQISQAFANIIQNALECMPGGGELKLEILRDQDAIVTRITDSGYGMDPEDLSSVYDPFFTSKTRGAGLGLTMVHRIMTHHNGEINIESRKGAGTTVTLRLPVSGAPGSDRADALPAG